jgi:hypothetical protein
VDGILIPFVKRWFHKGKGSRLSHAAASEEARGAPFPPPFCPLRGHFPRRGNLPIPRGSISSHSFAEKSAKVFFENDDGTDENSAPSFLLFEIGSVKNS